MKSRISKIIEEINQKKIELISEYDKLKEKYGFKIIKGKIVFNSEIKKKNKTFKESIWDTIFSASIRHILSIPFIYIMIIPAIILHIFLIFFQQTAFRLYKIPIVKTKDYIIFDRNELDYLNFIEKFNCMYCSYFNGLMSYAVEVGGRTEKYWCPIKHAKKMKGSHEWQESFADYGDPEGFRKCFNNLDFHKKNNK